MKALLAFGSLIGGFAIGLLSFDVFQWHVPPEYAPYVSVAALAGLDTIFGGLRAGIEGRFQNDIFASGFVLNTFLATMLSLLGDRMGIDLALVAVLVLGTRVFLNLSLIRRYWLNKRAIERSRQQEESAAVVAPAPNLSQKTEIGSI